MRDGTVYQRHLKTCPVAVEGAIGHLTATAAHGASSWTALEAWTDAGVRSPGQASPPKQRPWLRSMRNATD